MLLSGKTNSGMASPHGSSEEKIIAFKDRAGSVDDGANTSNETIHNTISDRNSVLYMDPKFFNKSGEYLSRHIQKPNQSNSTTVHRASAQIKKLLDSKKMNLHLNLLRKPSFDLKNTLGIFNRE